MRNAGIFILIVGACQGFLFTRQKCYDHIGCFSNGDPYGNAKGHVPESPDHIGVQFLLYTRQNPTHEQHLNPYDSGSVTRSHFVGSKETKFIIHGYQDDGHAPWIKSMTSAFLHKGDVNVIAVSWAGGADNINYIQAAANTRVVGAIVANMTQTLHSTRGAAYSTMHLIGHSLGSHISGYAGERIHRIGRITGLDPAGPLFENFDARVRLDPTDATFVDAIHTDADSLLELGFGLEKALGHADFYPNGGEKQPGCSREIGTHLFSLITGKIEQFKSTIACSHMRVLDLFTESITSGCGFQAYPCNSKDDFDAGRCHTCGHHGCSEMGNNAVLHKVHGKFYLSTAASSPYCH